MAKEEKEFKTGQPVKFSTENVDYTAWVKLKATDNAMYHRPGEVFRASEILARKFESEGIATRVK